MTILPITNEASQTMRFDFENSVLTINLVYLPMVQSWFLSVLENDAMIINGIRLAINDGTIRFLNKPYDFVVEEKSGTFIDPCMQDDFTSRCTLNILDRAEMIQIRGYDVP